MSTCDPGKDKRVLFSTTPAAKQSWAQRGDERRMMTLQDYVDFLHTGFDDMFEIAAVPESVMARMREEIEAHKPAVMGIEGPEVVDGCIHMTLVMCPPMSTSAKRTTIVVYPDGTDNVWEEDKGPT